MSRSKISPTEEECSDSQERISSSSPPSRTHHHGRCRSPKHHRKSSVSPIRTDSRKSSVSPHADRSSKSKSPDFSRHSKSHSHSHSKSRRYSDYSHSSRHSKSSRRSRSRSPHYRQDSGSRSHHHYSRYGGSSKDYSTRYGPFRSRGSASTPIAEVEQTSKKTIQAVPSPDVSSTVDTANLTAEQKLERALHAAQALAPKLPPYMAPGAANPVKFQTAQNKKKLMWNKKSSDNKWEGVSFGEGGGETQAKFRRLMGMGKASSNVSENESEKLKAGHEKLLSDLEQQYETSRFMTHLAKGAGLGYGMSSSSSRDADAT